MTVKVAHLYAEKALNEKLFAEGMITEDMYRAANEGIIIDIDSIAKKARAAGTLSDNRGISNGSFVRSAAAG